MSLLYFFTSLLLIELGVFTIIAATAPVPWFFIIVGIIAVGFVGLVVWTLIKSAKKRKKLNEKENSVYDGR